jgi:hypothetical protein
VPCGWFAIWFAKLICSAIADNYNTAVCISDDPSTAVWTWRNMGVAVGVQLSLSSIDWTPVFVQVPKPDLGELY